MKSFSRNTNYLYLIIRRVTPCSHVDGYQRFGGKYRLHIQGRISSEW
jgi:hypothetical protein